MVPLEYHDFVNEWYFSILASYLSSLWKFTVSWSFDTIMDKLLKSFSEFIDMCNVATTSSLLG